MLSEDKMELRHVAEEWRVAYHSNGGLLRQRNTIITSMMRALRVTRLQSLQKKGHKEFLSHVLALEENNVSAAANFDSFLQSLHPVKINFESYHGDTIFSSVIILLNVFSLQ